MQDESAILRQFMHKEGLSQAKIAVKAEVSQSTVSRALRGSIDRYSGARKKLFSYAGISESPTVRTADSAIRKITRAFNRIWDGSDVHAAAVAKVIDALSGFRPVAPLSEGGNLEQHSTPAQTKAKGHRPE
jgi:transcriptional regulator with XRE-family HTH domain